MLLSQIIVFAKKKFNNQGWIAVDEGGKVYWYPMRPSYSKALRIYQCNYLQSDCILINTQGETPLPLSKALFSLED